MGSRFIVAALTVLSILLCAGAEGATVTKGAGKGKPATTPVPPGKAPRFVEGQVLVGFVPGAAAALRAEAHGEAGGRLIRRLTQLNIDVVSVPAGAVPGSIAAYQRNPNVRFAEPNYLRRLTLPNEASEPWPYGGTINFMTEQWGLHNTGQQLFYDQMTGELGALKGTADADIDFDEAWTRLLGRPMDQSIVVAVLDSGVDCSHEDLNEKCINQQNFALSSPYGQADFIGHGTHVAGIAAAKTNNGLGTAGVGWNARIADLKVCYEEIDFLFGIVYGICADSDIAAGLVYAADQRYHVANMSLAGPVPGSTVGDAVNYAVANGMLIVAGAGNAYTQDRMYPAGFASVIAVGASDYFDNLASFSSFGNTWVHILAPGVNILSSLSTESCGVANCYGWNSGTSMATPFVSGAAALVWGYRKALGLDVSNTIVRDILQNSTDATGTLGQNFLAWVIKGRLNLNNAITLAEGGAPPPPPPGSTAVHVADLDGSGVNQGGTWSARVTVTVHADSNHGSVSGATVSGTWSNGYTGVGNCTTSGGTCMITSGNMPKKTVSATFTVNSVSGATFTYSAANNHDPDADSNGTTITVPKP